MKSNNVKVISDVQVGWQWHPGVVRVLGLFGEACVVAFHEAGQEGIGLLQGGDAS